MGRLVRINPATEEKNSQAAVVATGAHGRLVRTGDVQRTSPVGNTVKLPSRETERADELDKRTTRSASRQGENRSFGERLAKAAGSGLVAEGANLANLGGVAADRRGGTEMSAVYRRQAETLDKQIAALEKALEDPTMTAQDIRETNEALAIARSEREKYGKVIESGEKTALGLYDTADKGYSLAEKWGEESTAGTKGIEKGALKIVPAATQIGLQVAERAIAPGFDVAGRALSAAGANAADYRHKAGEQYDKEKAALRATVSALGVAAGGALSKGVNAAGLKLLRAAGKQNHILPNVLLGGANAVGYAAGETGASELSKAMTEEDYTPDWNAIGQTAMTAFAFGAITSAINAAAMTGRNKRYMNELNDAVKERYDYAKRIIEDPRATAGQKAAGAESVMNAADKMRGALDELQVVGAQKEVDAMREFLLSIYGEMMPYTGAGSAGAGTAGIAPVTPGGGIMTVRPGEGANPMQEAAPTAPITPRAAGAAAAQQNTMPAQPAAAQEGAQGMGEGNLTPMPQNAAQGAQEAKADALETGGRVPLDQYATPENANNDLTVMQGIADTIGVSDATRVWEFAKNNKDELIEKALGGVCSAYENEARAEGDIDFAPAINDINLFYSIDTFDTLTDRFEEEYIKKYNEVPSAAEKAALLMVAVQEGVNEGYIAQSSNGWYTLTDKGMHKVYDDIGGIEDYILDRRGEMLDGKLEHYSSIDWGNAEVTDMRDSRKGKLSPKGNAAAEIGAEKSIYDMPEGQNGGIDHGGQEVQNHAGGAEFADTAKRGTPEAADAARALPDGAAERGERERGGRESGRIPREVRNVGGEDGNALTVQKRLEASGISRFISPREANVPNGASGSNTVTIFEETDWDPELINAANWAKSKGVKKVTALLGVINIEKNGRTGKAFGVFNADTGEIFVNAGSMQRSVSETIEHETAHYLAEVARRENVRTFMRDVQSRYSSEEWGKVYDAYFDRYAALTGDYAGMSENDIELYVWEEIMGDAYAEIDQYDEKASRFNREAENALSQSGQESKNALQAEDTQGAAEQGRETAAATERRTGPPERFSYAGRDAGNADLEALHEAERYEMQNVDAETIRQKTGWFRGADGKWRWEIDDSDTETDTKWGFLRNPDAKRYNELFEKAYLYDIATAEDLNELRILDKNLKGVRKSPLYLDEIVRHDKLFEAYPALRDVKVRFEVNTGNKEGSYHPEENEFVLRTGLKLEPEKLKNTLFHEIQHAIQEREGFARGANPGYWDEMIQSGYSRRKNDGRIERARKEYHRIFDSAPEEFKDKVRRINRARLDGDYDAAETVVDELYDSEYADLWSQLDMAEFEWRSDRGEELNAYELYHNTAGEIEARDAAARRGLTAEERRGRKPNTGDENTVFADGGESYSIANTRDMPWKDQVRGYFSNDGTIKSSDSLYLGESSVEGVDNAPMYIPTSVITKAIRPPKGSRSAHALSQKNILNLQEGIKNAPVVIDNPARNSIVYVTADQDSAGNYIIAALDKSNDLYGETAHKVTSIHGRENIAAMLEKLGDDATIFVKNENKLNRMLPGNQILKSLALRAKVELDDNSVSGHGENVKYSAESDEFYERLDEELADEKEIDRQERAYEKAERDGMRTDFPSISAEWKTKLERARAAATNNIKPSGFDSYDAYLDALDKQHAADRAERLRVKSRDEFKGTKALDELGVKIANSAGIYHNAEQLLANDKAAKSIQKATKRAEQRLGATRQEKRIARDIANGERSMADIPRSVKKSRVLELVDYYTAQKATKTGLLQQQRIEINDALREQARELIGTEAPEINRKGLRKLFDPSKGLVLYHRTPQRIMRALFGWKQGQKINEAVFEPVYENEQERKRFINRLFDEVRTFEGADGEKSALNKDESAFAQKLKEGRTVEELVEKSGVAESIRAAAENLKNGAEMKDAAREFNLDEGSRNLTRQYADWLQTQEDYAAAENIDRTKIENAIEKYTELYDKLYAAINDFLVAHGYEPIGFIKGYAPHFQPEAENGKLESALKAIGVDLGSGVGKLPTSIAGLTKSFKPNKRYNPFFQHRRGSETDYDIVKGFETYVDYASDVLYHTDDIMRVRQMANYLRSTFAPEEMKADIDQMEAMRYAPADVKEEYLRDKKKIADDTFLSYEDLTAMMEQYTDEKYRTIEDVTEFSDLVTWLDDYANKLAGKQLFEDRLMEREVGREALNGAKKLNRMFARANVAGNLSSALNQTAQLPMIATELGQKNTWRAVGDILRGKTTGMSAFRGESDFLTEKSGIDYIQSTKGEKALKVLFSPLEKVDTLVSTIAVRGKYRMELDAGKSPKEAMKAADRWARDIMGTRSKGSVPLTFQSKNLIAQMMNMFQVEAANTFEHVTQDRLGPGFKEMAAKIGKDKAIKKLASDAIAYMLLAFLLNRLDEELYGGTPAPFDVLGMGLNAAASGNGLTSSDLLKTIMDNVTESFFGERLFDTDPDAMNDEFDGWAAAEDTMYNISNDVPYVRNVSGLLGVGDQTLPMPDIVGALSKGKKALKNADSPGEFWAEVAKQLVGLAGDTLPGGRQAEKMLQGGDAVIRGGSYQGFGDSKRLQYPVNSPLEDPWTALRAAIFGKNALPESRTYWAAGGKALSAAQTRLYEDLVDSGLSRKRAYEILKRFNDATADLEADRDKNGNPIGGSKKEKIVKEINKLPLSRKQKNMLYLSRGYSEKDLNSLPWN